jgi:hypothetical protein
MGKRKESPSGRLIIGSSFVTNAFTSTEKTSSKIKSPGESTTNKSKEFKSKKDKQSSTPGKPGESSEGTTNNKEKINDDQKEKESK